MEEHRRVYPSKIAIRRPRSAKQKNHKENQDLNLIFFGSRRTVRGKQKPYLASTRRKIVDMNIMTADPGLSGGLCFVVDGSVVELLDMPTLPDGSNRQVDIMAVCRRIDKHKPTHAIIENVQPMPSIPGANGVRRGMGAASSFRFGFAVGQMRSCMVCYGMEVRLVHPQSWKRWAGLKGSDKEQSRQKALELMPSAAQWLMLKKSHNKAEALLLALYGLDTLGML